MKNNQPTGKIEWIKPELIVDISNKHHSIEGKSYYLGENTFGGFTSGPS